MLGGGVLKDEMQYLSGRMRINALSAVFVPVNFDQDTNCRNDQRTEDEAQHAEEVQPEQDTKHSDQGGHIAQRL